MFTNTWGGSEPGKSPNLDRDFDGAFFQLWKHYFKGEESLYTYAQFKRRFRVSPEIFERVYEKVSGKPPFYHPLRTDATKKRCIHPLVRLTAVFRVLAYGTAADLQDEYLQLSESITNNAVRGFWKILIAKFGD